jgi:hypothetical protein
MNSLMVTEIQDSDLRVLQFLLTGVIELLYLALVWPGHRTLQNPRSCAGINMIQMSRSSKNTSLNDVGGIFYAKGEK